jgi:glycosyltransferase involved in cell wall biosynthesis
VADQPLSPVPARHGIRLSPFRPANAGLSVSVTAVLLLYNAERTVPTLVRALARQQRVGMAQHEWLEAVFVDDCSRDGTLEVLERCLEEQGRPRHWRVVRHERNLGLAATLNESLAGVTAPFALTCHCDCEFGSEDYVTRMTELIAARPDAGAITGKPTVVTDPALPFAERVNIVANLMDVLPADTTNTLEPVGFAEGRCDVFRVEALRQVGFYDTTLRTCGEDQVLAARLRDTGYEVYLAPQLTYRLSVSDEQDSVLKLVQHQRLFGRVHPYIMLRIRRASRGVAGARAGRNRQSRLLLRVHQLGSSGLLGAAIVSVARGHFGLAAGFLAGILAVKALLFRRHLACIPFSASEILAFAALQPVLDGSYAWGFVQGLLRILAARRGRPIDS